MVEQQKRMIQREDKDFQETAFAIARILRGCSEGINPLFDFSNRRSRLKHSALKARLQGLINQNPVREDLEKVK